MALKPMVSKGGPIAPVQKYIGTAYDVVRKVHDNLDAILNLDLQAVNTVNDEFTTLQTNITQLFNDTEVLLTQIGTNASNLQATATRIEEAVVNFGKYYLGTKDSNPSLNNESALLVEGNFYFNSTSNTLRFYTGSSWISPQEIAINAANSASASANTATTQATRASYHEANAEAAKDSAETSEAVALHYRNAAHASANDAGLSASAAETSKIGAETAETSATTKAQEAFQSAAAALLSEQNASTSEQNAASSESTALNSESVATAAKGYLESYLFHYIEDDNTSVTVGIGTQVLVSESTSGYPSVLLELSIS